eukprot:TRINITY_DN4562_c0_g2_i1.p2 TRINITY_DN4562_c0_g2~~TRINITY_DN4562_c0_g2_i1.p2  ORF type:complete len:173 (-),score=22.34 TRINITY_DN4562_c0_g2_i1:111-629(-)
MDIQQRRDASSSLKLQEKTNLNKVQCCRQCDDQNYKIIQYQPLSVSCIEGDPHNFVQADKDHEFMIDISKFFWKLKPEELQHVLYVASQRFPNCISWLLKVGIKRELIAEILTQKLEEAAIQNEQFQEEFYKSFYGCVENVDEVFQELLNGRQRFGDIVFQNVLKSLKGLQD